MASLQERNGSYRIQFCHRGKLHGFTIGKVERSEAESKAQQVDYLLMRLKQKLLSLPDDCDIVTFLQHDGDPPEVSPKRPDSPRKDVTIAHLRDRWVETYANGTIEAKRRIAAGKDADEIWEALYLKTDEVAELLEYVKARDTSPWVYPMFVFAAHTGARRSEIIRVTRSGVDFEGNVVTLSEKKRVRGQKTLRRVPLTPFLRDALSDWLKIHPGGPHLFCHASEVARSRKRSAATGHKGEKTRASGQNARMATVKRREAPAPEALTRNEVRHFFKGVLSGSNWEVIRGLHTLRHSMISACATKGVDQRLVEAWAGHMSAEMSRRYAHLWPSKQQEAISSVFE
jgi:integrase